MAKSGKEMSAYLSGMAYACKIAKEKGVEGLEKEINFRGIADIPMNVSSDQLIALARARAHEELLFVAVASATTLTEYLKMTPSTTKGYLREFNNNVELYRRNPELFEEAQKKLDRNIGLNEACKSYMMEVKDNGKEH